jgi:hypothetical protein
MALLGPSAPPKGRTHLSALGWDLDERSKKVGGVSNQLATDIEHLGFDLRDDLLTVKLVISN